MKALLRASILTLLVVAGVAAFASAGTHSATAGPGPKPPNCPWLR
jgi:uncharacterized protein YraI